jgi:hypothetical protein
MEALKSWSRMANCFEANAFIHGFHAGAAYREAPLKAEVERANIKLGIAHKAAAEDAFAIAAAKAEIERLKGESIELDALRSGARTGMLKYMLAGDVGCFADRMKQLLQAEDWDQMRLTVLDFFNCARDHTEKGRIELERLETELARLRGERG